MISKKILKAVLLNSKIPLGLMFVGVSIWGLSNFYYIGKQGLYFYLDASIPLTHEHFHEDKAFAHGEFHPILNNKGMEYCANVTAEASWLLSAYAVDVLASIWSGIVSGSLFAMALPSYFIPGNFIDWCYDRRNALAPYSKAITYSAAILAIFAGIIGGAPNLYQSFYTGQNVATNIASVISSNNIELPALYVILLGAIRLLSRIIGGIKNSCVTQSEEAKMAEFQIKLFEMADEILREANSLENLSAEQKQTLYKEYQSIQAGKNIVKNENATITDIGSAGRDAENDLRVSGSFSDEDDRCKASDVRSELVVISEENELPPQ